MANDERAATMTRKKTPEQPPCSCHEHTCPGDTPAVIGKHTFRREEGFTDWSRWRWRCGCGVTGQWQAQAPSCSYHGWLQHVTRFQ